jgi:nicotinamidase-related amidase
MAHRFGFFDTDCRELDERGSGLAYRPRVRPIVPQLERLYALAQAHNYPLLFTTCCSGRMPLPAALPHTCWVPLNDTETSWRKQLGSARRFYLAKRTSGVPQTNFTCRYFDMFEHNANAGHLLRELAVQTWVVFGNGFDLCVGAAVRGILRAGQAVILLEDVRISSAGATAQSEQETLRTLRNQGAQVMTLSSFLEQVARA